MRPSNEPDFASAMRIKPAFAGFLVDFTIGAKEITATILDLILRDALYVQAGKLYRLKKSGLTPFEEKFISAIFGPENELSFEEVAKRAYDVRSDKLLGLICEGAIEDGLLASDFQQKLAAETKAALKEELPGADIRIPENAPAVYKKADCLKFLFLLGVAGFFVFFFLGAQQPKKSSLALVFGAASILSLLSGMVVMVFLTLLKFFLWPFAAAQGLSKNVTARVERKVGIEIEDWILSDKGKAYKCDCLRLREFISSYPMLEDRLANELVAHSVAFGVGRVWMRKFGSANAEMLELFEKLSSSQETYGRLIDWTEYLKNFR